MKGLFQLLKEFSACGGQASIAYARLRARPPVSLRSCLAPALRASLIAYRRIAYKSTLTVSHSCCVCRMAEPYRIMLKQVAYNVFIGPLAVPILFELQHGLLKTGFSRRTPPTCQEPTPHSSGFQHSRCTWRRLFHALQNYT